MICGAPREVVGDKRCPDCERLLPASDFGRNASRPDGLAFYCKQCFARRSAASYRTRREAAGHEVRQRVDLPPGHLRCADCREVKPERLFHRAPRQASGRSSYCAPCRAVRNETGRLRRLYGLDHEKLADWREAQGDLCAVCRKHPPKHVDHDHRTGQVRGLTCFRCNAALGQFGDDVDVLLRAVDYLRATSRYEAVAPGVHALRRPAPHGPARRPQPDAALEPLLALARRSGCRD